MSKMSFGNRILSVVLCICMMLTNWYTPRAGVSW